MSNTNQNKYVESSILPLILCMSFITAKIICDPLFMNQIELNLGFMSLHVTQSTMSYGLVFILVDLIFFYCGRRIAIIVLFAGILLDGLYSCAIHSVGFFPIPYSTISHATLPNVLAIHQLASPIWSLWAYGIIASSVTYLLELLVFGWLIKSVFNSNFFLSSIVSVTLTMTVHNYILYSEMFKSRAEFWNIYLSNLTVDISIVLFYSTAVTIFVMLHKKFKKFKKFKKDA
jgi:uncharacterized PurR-regulated membrane protein YhhQ (DUF165 family)